MLSVLAVICGADSFVAIALFGQLNEAWLPALPHGIPSHDTLGRVFGLDAEEGFRDWVQDTFALTGQVVPRDGKSVRGSHDRGRGLGPLHLVSAWAQANRLVLAQTAVEDDSNEITAIPELLRMLCLEGCIVTLDGRWATRRRCSAKSGHRKRCCAWKTFALERADFADCDYADTVGKDQGASPAAAGPRATPPITIPTGCDREWRPGRDRHPLLPPASQGPTLWAVRQHCENAQLGPGCRLWRGRQASARATPPTTWPSSSAWHNLCGPRRWALPTSGWRRPADYLCRLIGLKPKEMQSHALRFGTG